MLAQVQSPELKPKWSIFHDVAITNIPFIPLTLLPWSFEVPRKHFKGTHFSASMWRASVVSRTSVRGLSEISRIPTLTENIIMLFLVEILQVNILPTSYTNDHICPIANKTCFPGSPSSMYLPFNTHELNCFCAESWPRMPGIMFFTYQELRLHPQEW